MKGAKVVRTGTQVVRTGKQHILQDKHTQKHPDTVDTQQLLVLQWKPRSAFTHTTASGAVWNLLLTQRSHNQLQKLSQAAATKTAA